jgi:predicted nicotinamide N-methyase
MIDRRAFIKAETRILPVPHAPEINLHLADEAVALWKRTEDELAEMGLPPPFWAFAWAGGQALARYLLDHPAEVAGKRVLDFASGSGLVGIAAMKSGAAHVEATDIDAFAIEAVVLNAALNHVVVTPHLSDVIGRDAGWDIICAGDVCYEKDMAEHVTSWLFACARRGARVLIGDPGRAYLPHAQLHELAEYQVPVTRTLEDSDVKRTKVWTFSEI